MIRILVAILLLASGSSICFAQTPGANFCESLKRILAGVEEEGKSLKGPLFLDDPKIGLKMWNVSASLSPFESKDCSVSQEKTELSYSCSRRFAVASVAIDRAKEFATGAAACLGRRLSEDSIGGKNPPLYYASIEMASDRWKARVVTVRVSPSRRAPFDHILFLSISAEEF